MKGRPFPALLRSRSVFVKQSAPSNVPAKPRCQGKWKEVEARSPRSLALILALPENALEPWAPPMPPG